MNIDHIREGEIAWVLFAGPREPRHGDGSDLLESLRQLAARLELWENRHSDWPRGEPVDKSGAGAVPNRRDHIRRWIEIHHREQVGLDDIADELGLSRFQASRAIRQSTGHGFAELLQGARLVTARALLRETDLSIVDVVMRSGFSDRSHFHRVFRRETGMTPKDWRSQSGNAGVPPDGV